MSDIECVICDELCETGGGISQYAAYGGLPSPCCETCFSANDYTIKNTLQLQVRSLKRRLDKGIEIKMDKETVLQLSEQLDGGK